MQKSSKERSIFSETVSKISICGMNRFASKVSASTPEFAANYVHNAALATTLKERLATWSKQGTDAALSRAKKCDLANLYVK
jgi:hypothetical protein